MPKFYLCDTKGNPSTGAPSEIMGDFCAIAHDCPKCGELASKGRTLAWLATEAGGGGEARFSCMSCGEPLVFPREAFKPAMLESLNKHFQPNALLRATAPEEVLQPDWGALLYRANGAEFPEEALQGTVVSSSTEAEPLREATASENTPNTYSLEELELPADAGASDAGSTQDEAGFLEELELPADAEASGAGSTEDEAGFLEELELPAEAGAPTGGSADARPDELDLGEPGGGLEDEAEPEGPAPSLEFPSIEDELEAPLYTAEPLETAPAEKFELETGSAEAAAGEGLGIFDDTLGEALDGAALLDDRPDADMPAAPEPATMHEPPGLGDLTGDLEELAAPAPAPQPEPAEAPGWSLDGGAGDELVFDDAPTPIEEPGPGDLDLDKEPDIDMDFETAQATENGGGGFASFEDDIPAAPAPAAAPAGWSGHGPCPACGHDAPRHQSQRLACPACAAMFWVRGDALERETDTTLCCPCCQRDFVVPASVWCRTCKQNTHGFRRVRELIREANGLTASAPGMRAKPGKPSRGKRA